MFSYLELSALPPALLPSSRLYAGTILLLRIAAAAQREEGSPGCVKAVSTTCPSRQRRAGLRASRPAGTSPKEPEHSIR
jgi:hypothetical protein